MLSKLFKTRIRFDDADPEARRRAVLDIPEADSGEFQAELAELAVSDPDLGVRRAAVARLTRIDLLKRLLDDSHREVADGAAEALAREAAAGTDVSLLAVPAVRLAAIRTARDLESVAAVIGDVEYDADLVRLAVDSKNAKVRLAVADKLQREASLAELERASRHRDKNVHRLARNRLDEIRQARAGLAKGERRAQELLDNLESQLRVEPDHLFPARLGVIRQDWSANELKMRQLRRELSTHGIETAEHPDLGARFDAANTRAEDALSRIEPSAAPSAKPSAESVSEAPTEAAPVPGEFETILAELGALYGDLRKGQLDPTALGGVHDRVAALKDHWLATADHAPPPAPVADRFHEVTHAFQELFDAAGRLQERGADIAGVVGAAVPPASADTPEEHQALWTEQRRARHAVERIERMERAVAWPQVLPVPPPLESLVQQRTALLEFDRRCHDLHEALCERLREMTERLHTEIEMGHLANAVGLEGEGKRLLRCLPAGSAKRLQQDFNAFSVRVLELKDWRTFATSPKREELCTEIEALAATPLDPAQQAERIRQLREAFKGLGPATIHHDRKLLDRFNRAAETAFEPCRTYFEQQAQRRKFNLEQRIKICEQLETYLDGTDWTKPDWRAAEHILRVARNEWRSFHPVDRSPGRKVQVRFDGLSERLHGHIKSEWDRNVAAKQGIVDEARALQSSGQEAREVANQLKSLQKRWQQVGITPRRVDQRLWQSFRAICDEVFGHREEARAARQQTLESSATRATAICDELEHAIEDATPETASLESLAAISDRYHAIADLPRDAARRLDQRFRDLERSYRALLREEERRSVLSTVRELHELDELVGEVENDVIAGGIADAETLTMRLAPLTDAERDLRDAFAPRLTALQKAMTVGAGALREALEAAHTRRHDLAVEMEIVAGLETPSEDQQRRLAMQVSRLNQGMRSRGQVVEDPIALAHRFCSTGPAAADAARLRDRFFAACEAALE